MSEGHNDSDLDINDNEGKLDDTFSEQRTDLQETVAEMMANVNDETSAVQVLQLLLGFMVKLTTDGEAKTNTKVEVVRSEIQEQSDKLDKIEEVINKEIGGTVNSMLTRRVPFGTALETVEDIPLQLKVIDVIFLKDSKLLIVEDKATQLLALVSDKTLSMKGNTPNVCVGDIVRVDKYQAMEGATFEDLPLDVRFDDIIEQLGIMQRPYKYIEVGTIVRTYRRASDRLDEMSNQLNELKTSVHIANTNSTVLVETLRESMTKENKDQTSKKSSVAHTTSKPKNDFRNSLISVQMSDGKPVAKTDEDVKVESIDDVDSGDEEENRYKDFLTKRDELRTKRIKGHTRVLTTSVLERIVLVINMVVNAELDRSPTFDVRRDPNKDIIFKIQGKLSDHRILYAPEEVIVDGKKKTIKAIPITQADIELIWKYLFHTSSDDNQSKSKSGEGLVVQLPTDPRLVADIAKEIPTAMEIIAKTSHNLKQLDAAKQAIITIPSNTTIQTISLFSIQVQQTLAAANANRTDEKGLQLKDKIANIQTSKERSTLTIEDCIDMWTYAISPSFKEEFNRLLFTTMVALRKAEGALPDDLSLNYVSFFNHVATRCSKHLYEFMRILRLICTYQKVENIPDIMPKTHTNLLNKDQTPQDLYSILVKSSDMQPYMANLQTIFPHHFLNLMRHPSNSTEPFTIEMVVNKFQEAIREHVDLSNKSNALQKLLVNVRNSHDEFHRGYKPSIVQPTKPSSGGYQQSKLPFNSPNPSSQVKPTNRFHSMQPDFSYSLHPQQGVVYANDDFNEYDSFNRRSTIEQEQIYGYLDRVDNVNALEPHDPLYQLAGHSRQDAIRQVPPDVLGHALNALKPFTQFEKHQASTRTEPVKKPLGPCFPYFKQPRECFKTPCNFSHDPKVYLEYLDRERDRAKSLSPSSNSLSHVTFHTDEGERGKEQGTVPVISQLNTDNGDDAELYNAFDQADDETQHKLMSLCYSLLQQQAGQVMHRDGQYQGGSGRQQRL